MLRPIFISLIPNFLPRHIWLSFRLFLKPWEYVHTAWNDELRRRLEAYLGVPRVILADSGRTALYLLLKALRIGAGDEVVMQAFTCVAVPNAVKWVEATPIYADIDATFNLDPDGLLGRITPKTKALIVQHTFGYPANLERILEICKQKKLILIEDCAHGLGGSWNGKKLGTIGDAAFMSFGRDKVISGVWGGGAYVRDEAAMALLVQLGEKLPRRNSLWIARELLYAPFTALVVSTYRFCGLGKLLHYLFRMTRLTSAVITRREKRGERIPMYQLPSPLAKIAAEQLRELESMIAHRRTIAKYYAESFHIPYRVEHTYLRFPMLTVIADRIRLASSKRGMFLGDWYTVPVAPESVDQRAVGYVSGSCPRAEQAAEHILNLPTHIRTSLPDAARIVDLIKTDIQLWTLRK